MQRTCCMGCFDRARDSLSDDDLACLPAVGDAAQSTVRNLADLCEGLGCLILGDGNYSDAGAAAGISINVMIL